MNIKKIISKKNIITGFIFILVLNIIGCSNVYRSKEYYKIINKEVFIPIVQCRYSALPLIIDSIFRLEKKCEYYNDSLAMGIEILPTRRKHFDKHLPEFNDKINIYIREQSYFLYSNPKGVFFVGTHPCFLSEVSEYYFLKTGEYAKLNYPVVKYLRKLRKNEKPIDFSFQPGLFLDERWSEARYMLKDGKFVCLWFNQPCNN